MNMQIRRDVILDTLMAAVNVLRQWKMNQFQSWHKQTLPVVRYLSKVATSYVNIDWFGKKNAWIEARCLLQDTKKGP